MVIYSEEPVPAVPLVLRTRIVGSRFSGFCPALPLGSELGPTMFLIYVNDTPMWVHSYMRLFTDDAKLMRRVMNNEHCNNTQEDLINS